MIEIIINLLNGISIGMILFIMASGLSIIFGVMGILNLAHGAFYVLGAYLGLTLSKLGLDFFITSLLAGASVGIIGLGLERTFLSRLYKQINDQVLLTLGLVYIFWNLVLWIWGPRSHINLPPAIFKGTITIFNFNYPLYRLIIIFLGICIFYCLWFFQEKTRTGAIMRAGMDDKQMVIGLGINYNLFSTFIFFLGAFLGGLAGYLGTPILGIMPALCIDILLFSLIVIVVGGVGNIKGTLLGAILIGVIDSFGKSYFPNFAMFTIYLAMIFMLLTRPYGLLGRMQLVETGKHTQFSELPFLTEKKQQSFLVYFLIFIIFLILLLLPTFVPPYIRTIVIRILIYGIFSLSLNILFGYCGLFSLGHASFFGLGGYTAAILITHYNISNFWIVLVVSILITIFFALIFGAISLKVSGVYFLLVTMAIGQLLENIAIKWRSFTGGSDGIVGIAYPNLGILGINMDPKIFYYFVLIIFIICVFLLYCIGKSPFALILQGIRGDENRMECLGYNTWFYKYLSIILSGIFACLAGILSMYQLGFVGPGQLGILTSTMAMLIIILGSEKVFWGPLIGAALIIFIEYISSLYTPERWPLILGSVFVSSVMFLRGGIAIHIMKILERD